LHKSRISFLQRLIAPAQAHARTVPMRQASKESAARPAVADAAPRMSLAVVEFVSAA